MFRLLHVQAAYCAFEYATDTQLLALEMVKQLKEAEFNECNYAALYVEFSMLYYMKSEYDHSYRYLLYFSFINLIIGKLC